MKRNLIIPEKLDKQFLRNRIILEALTKLQGENALN